MDSPQKASDPGLKADSHRRLRDISVVVTVTGIVCLGTALPRVFLPADTGSLLVVTSIMIFSIWLALIIIGYILSAPLLEDETE